MDMLNRKRIADRREFLGACAGAIAAGFAARESRAADLPHVAPTDPTAAALGYVEDSAAVDAAKYPQHQADQKCLGCQQFTRQDGSAYGPCQIYPGKSVSERGWCGAYVARA
jgi:hypothetical protein